MRYYIGTVWFLSAMAEAVDGDSAIERTIIRRQFENEQDFILSITDEKVTFRDVDNQIWFGPISLSKEQ